jgi:hypothetical protein
MRKRDQFRKAVIFGMVAALWLGCALCGAASAAAGPDAITGTALDRGFLGLYNLDFTGTQKDFSSWEVQHPDDPVGPVSEASGISFLRVQRLGVLEGQFYDNDEAFTARSKLSPDPVVHDHFQAAIEQADKLAHARLNQNGKDQDALFALTLSSGLQADYAALIEKKNLASLHYATLGAAIAGGVFELLRRASGDGIQQVHRWKHVDAGALAAEDGRITRGQKGWHGRFAADRSARALSGAICPHSAGDRVCAG